MFVSNDSCRHWHGNTQQPTPPSTPKVVKYLKPSYHHQNLLLGPHHLLIMFPSSHIFPLLCLLHHNIFISFAITSPSFLSQHSFCSYVICLQMTFIWSHMSSFVFIYAISCLCLQVLAIFEFLYIDILCVHSTIYWIIWCVPMLVHDITYYGMLVYDFCCYRCSYSLMLVDDMTLNDVVWFGWMISNSCSNLLLGYILHI